MAETEKVWTTLKKGTVAGVTRGWSGFGWMMKIIVPISLGTAVLDWSGLLHHLDFFLEPVMSLLSLPPAAALPLIAAMLTSIYGGIGALLPLPFSTEQLTLITVFILMCHGLIQEGIIQGKSGIHPVKATLVRMGAATVTVLIIAPWVGSSTVMPNAAGAIMNAQPAFWEMIRAWAWTTLSLSVRIFFIIMALLTILELLKAFGLVNPLIRILSPFLRIMGLNEKVGFLWMTAVIFGLSYGGAIIVEEAKSGQLSKDDLEILHLSIGMNHSVIEDPPIFMAMGVHAFWLYVPRILMAIVTVRLLRLWYRRTRQPLPAA
jgi:hypothetical protein